MDLQKFLEGVEAKKAENDAKPTREEVFMDGLISAVIDALGGTHGQLTTFLKSGATKIEVANLPDKISTPDVKEVVKAIKALKFPVDDDSAIIEAIKGIQLNPTYKPEIKVAPTPVQVAAPQVHVDAPDFKPVVKAIKDNKPDKVDFTEIAKLLKDNIKAMKAVEKAVIQKPIPVANTPTDPLINYTPADIDDAGTVQYFGFTQIGGAWYIRQYDTSVSPKTLRFCFGQSNYATNFANRAALTYTIWGT